MTTDSPTLRLRSSSLTGLDELKLGDVDLLNCCTSIDIRCSINNLHRMTLVLETTVDAELPVEIHEDTP